MKKSSLFCVAGLSLMTAGVHLYLTLEHFKLKYTGLEQSAVCNFNDYLNCSNALTSDYAQIFSIPISILGCMLFLILTITSTFFYVAEDNTNKTKYGTISFALNALSITATLLMAAVSFLILKSLCPLCLTTYILSAIIAVFVIKDMSSFFRPSYLFKDFKVLIITLAFFSFGSFAMSAVLKNKFQVNELDEIIQLRIQDWKSKSPKQISTISPIVEGPVESSFHIVEFADYQCGHCKVAYEKTHLFLKSHPDVKLSFMNFPLDGCQKTGDIIGKSCQLAMMSICSLKFQREQETQNYLFSTQKDNYNLTSSQIQENLLANVDIEIEPFNACMKNPETYKTAMAQLELGRELGVKGTPGFFVNGKSFPGARDLQTLESAYKNK